MEKLLIDYDQVFLIFDRYNSDSIKGEERLVRSKGVTRTYVLSLGVEMPAQKIVTSVTRNKVQLIDLIVASLTDDPILSKSCLILTRSQETPYKIQDGKVELCHELRTLHEEADVVIINQLIESVMRTWLSKLYFVGDLSCDFDALYSMAVQFLSLCYGIKPENQQSSIIPTRIKVWYRMVSTNIQYNPSLKQIPTTDNSFRANVRRAHYQAAIWRSCEAQDPPQESSEDFRWYKDDISGFKMLPKFHDTSPVLAPEELLKLIRCQCKAMEGRCTHKKCSCSEANVPCTKFCGCSFDGKNCERQVQQ